MAFSLASIGSALSGAIAKGAQAVLTGLPSFMGSAASSVGGAMLGYHASKKLAEKQYELNRKLSIEGMSRTYKYDRALMRYQNAYNTQMSNTAHQREMSDLQAAGLNPILAVNDGASTPTSGSGGIISSDSLANSYNSAMATAIDAIRLSNETALKNSQTKLNDSQVDVNSGIEKVNESQVNKSNAETSSILQDIINKTNLTNAQINSINSGISVNDTVKRLNKATERYTNERSRGFSESIHGPFGFGFSRSGNQKTVRKGSLNLYGNKSINSR